VPDRRTDRSSTGSAAVIASTASVVTGLPAPCASTLMLYHRLGDESHDRNANVSARHADDGVDDAAPPSVRS
jgi:hypothetical protein